MSGINPPSTISLFITLAPARAWRMCCLPGRLPGTIDTSRLVRAIQKPHEETRNLGLLREISRGFGDRILNSVPGSRPREKIEQIKSLAPSDASCYKDAPEGALIQEERPWP